MTDFNQKTHDTDVGSYGGQSRQMTEVFENQEFGSIRLLQEAGKTFFCASDVAKALGYGHDRYAVLDMEEYRQYEKLMAMQKLMTELEKGRRSGGSRGTSLRRMWKRNWESMTKVKMPMAGEINCPACLVKIYAMMTMRKRIPGQQKMRCPGIFLVSNMIMEFCTMVS